MFFVCDLLHSFTIKVTNQILDSLETDLKNHSSIDIFIDMNAVYLEFVNCFNQLNIASEIWKNGDFAMRNGKHALNGHSSRIHHKIDEERLQSRTDSCCSA